MIRSYSVASTTKAAFLIGGWDGSSALDIIAKFENTEWSIYGYLRQARKGHASITFRTQTIVIGGRSNSLVTDEYHFKNYINPIKTPSN